MRSLKLEDQPLMKERFLRIGDFLSEYCFSNIYLFREKHQYQLIHEGLCMFIKGVSYDQKRYIMPGCELEGGCPFYIQKLISLLEDADMLFPIAEGWLKYFPEDTFRYEALEEDMDYLYKKEKLRDYPGRKLHSKRNLLKQFNETYQSEVVPLNGADAVEQAKSILTKWQNDAGLSQEEADFLPCMEALDLIDSLDLEGFLFFADGKAAGFTLGEKVSSTVFGLHFAKANKEVKGIYQYMFSETAARISSDYEWINLEQDLGSVQLRAAKASYQPDFMAKKFRIYRK